MQFFYLRAAKNSPYIKVFNFNYSCTFLTPQGGYLLVASLGENPYLDHLFGSCGFARAFYGSKSCLVSLCHYYWRYKVHKPKTQKCRSGP